MNDLYALTKSFQRLQDKYEWSEDEACSNLLEVLNSLQWAIVYPVPMKDGYVDYGRLAVEEVEQVRELLLSV